MLVLFELSVVRFLPDSLAARIFRWRFLSGITIISYPRMDCSTKRTQAPVLDGEH